MRSMIAMTTNGVIRFPLPLARPGGDFFVVDSWFLVRPMRLARVDIFSLQCAGSGLISWLHVETVAPQQMPWSSPVCNQKTAFPPPSPAARAAPVVQRIQRLSNNSSHARRRAVEIRRQLRWVGRGATVLVAVIEHARFCATSISAARTRRLTGNNACRARRHAQQHLQCRDNRAAAAG